MSLPSFRHHRVHPAVLLVAGSLVGCSVDIDDLFNDDAADGGGSAQGAGSPNGGGAQGGDASGPGGFPSHGGESSNGGQPSDGGGTTTVSESCGDNIINGLEECDGNDFGGLDCTDFGSDSPAGLTCSGSCTIDTSNCQEPTECGNGSQEAGEECDDGNNLANDGCSPTCSIDGTCQSPVELQIGMGTTSVFGDTTNAQSQENPGNVSYCQGATGPEIVFRITPDESGVATLYLPSSGTVFDAAMYVSQNCVVGDDTPCHDNYNTLSGDNGGEVLSFPVTAGTPFYAVIDGFHPEDSGAFELTIDLSSGEDCSDPIPIMLEGDAGYDLYGNTSGHMNNGASSQVSTCGGAGAGPDLVYEITSLEGDDFNFEMFTQFNSVLHARSSCESQETQFVCSAPVNSNGSSFNFSSGNGETNYVFADGTMSSSGFYTLRISH